MAKSSKSGIALRSVTTAGGETVLYARFYIPERKGSKVAFRRVERSTRTSDGRKARQFAKAVIETAYEKLKEEERREEVKEVKPTFARAAATYMKTTGNIRYMAKILQYFGTASLDEITQTSVYQAAEALYPGCSPQTWNRHVFTPVISVMNLAAAETLCPAPAIRRPKGWDHKPPIRTPKDEWFDQMLPHARPELRALAFLWTLHNLRIQEALNRTSNDFDPVQDTLIIDRTKNGEPVQLRLSKPASDAIKAYDWRDRECLFGTRHRTTIYKWVRAACAAAGVPYFNPYAFGKHRFASRHLERGKSLKWVQEAGRWKTIKMVAERYGHLERRELEDEMNEFSEKWAGNVNAPKRLSVVSRGGNVGEKF
jgi:integrase